MQDPKGCLQLLQPLLCEEAGGKRILPLLFLFLFPFIYLFFYFLFSGSKRRRKKKSTA